MKWSVFSLSRMFSFPSTLYNTKAELLFQTGIIMVQVRPEPEWRRQEEKAVTRRSFRLGD